MKLVLRAMKLRHSPRVTLLSAGPRAVPWRRISLFWPPAERGKIERHRVSFEPKPSVLNAPTPLRLGRYQLLERLAVGGMAEVWRATAMGFSGFEKTVVVKRLLPQHQRDQELLTMFVDEARLLARLRHDNIAEVYDIDHEGNECFFALEHVDGTDLRTLLDAQEGGPLGLPESLWIVSQVAQALGHAHALKDEHGRDLNVVHRDVSPANVLVGRDGRVKLVDFGVAKWQAQRSETRHGVLKGKVNYMSPEQCRGEPLDRRSDVFAVGVLLYELTVGERPFARQSDFETLKAIAEGHYVRPSLRLPAYPQVLEAIVNGALELRVADRTADMATLLEQVATFSRQAGVGVEAASLPRLVERVVGITVSTSVVGPHAAPRAATGTPQLAERTATALGSLAPPANAKFQGRISNRLAWGAAGAAAVAMAVVLWLLRPLHEAGPPKQSDQRVATSRALAPSPPLAVDPSPMQAPLAPASPSSTAVTPALSRRARPSRPKTRVPLEAQPVVVEKPSVPPTLWDPDSPVPP